MRFTRGGALRTVIRVGNADHRWATPGTEVRTSARDLANLITIGLTHPQISTRSFTAFPSAPNRFSNARAAELGYVPQDRALDHLDPAFQPYEAMAPGAGRDHVGGYYAVVPLPDVRLPA